MSPHALETLLTHQCAPLKNLQATVYFSWIKKVLDSTGVIN